MKEYNSFHIALQLQFIHKLTKNAYIKAPTKTQCTTTKQAFVKNYDDIDDKHNSVPSPEIEVETQTAKKETKKKKHNSCLFPPATLINFTKNLLQPTACKSRGKLKEQVKNDKFKKWVPAKPKKIITERNQRK